VPFVQTSRFIELVDGGDPFGATIPALVLRDVPASRLEVIEAAWEPARAQATRYLAVSGLTTEHSHWDWRSKARLVESAQLRLVAVECQNEVQGLMAVRTLPSRSHTDGGSVLYVDYLETAPWNLRSKPVRPRFLGIGKALIREAVRVSHDSGWQGRIGLHSLVQAVGFYSGACQMRRFGADPDYYDLEYFEYTMEQGIRMLADGGI
jgi:hypothetical protein